MDPEARDRAAKLVQDYHDHLEPYDIEHQRLESDDALSMMRILMEARPRLINGMDALADRVAEPGTESSSRLSSPKFKFWDRQGLSSVLAQQDISVAVTPNGPACSVQYDDQNKEEYVTMPLMLEMPVEKLFQRFDDPNEPEVYQLQGPNGNVWNRSNDVSDNPSGLNRFQRYIPRGPLVMQMLGREPAAVNLWIGTSKSTTTLRQNQYDSLHQVLGGSQTFTLISPIEGFLLNPKRYKIAAYQRGLDGSLQLIPDTGASSVLSTTVNLKSLSTGADQPLRPVTITVREGAWLYLPARWWFHIQYTEGDERICVAVKHSYRTPFRSDLYAMERYISDSLGFANSIILDNVNDENDSVEGESWDSQSTQSWGELNRRH